jgi:hypothetical protein
LGASREAGANIGRHGLPQGPGALATLGAADRTTSAPGVMVAAWIDTHHRFCPSGVPNAWLG